MKLYLTYNHIKPLFLSILFGLVVLLGFTPAFVLAQTVVPGEGGSAQIITPSGAFDLLPTAGPAFPIGGPGTFNTEVTPTTPADPITTGPTTGGVAGGDGGDEPISPVTIPPGQELKYLNSYIYGFMVTIGGLFTWFGGLMLDTSLQYFVVEMGEQLLEKNFGFTVDATWTIIRDIFNILFIFVLVWIGLKTILNSDDSGAKKQLGMLIIAALLINFSLLITKTVIDFTNIAAVQIYNKIEVRGDGATAGVYEGMTGTAVTAVSSSKSISGAFMTSFNLASYANPDQVQISGQINSVLDWRVVSFGFLIMCVMIIAGFAFLAGAVLMLYRFVALIIYMILSPAMFLGWIYPGFASHSKKWWDGFLKNAFVAPAYLFMIYVALRVADGLPATSGMNFGNAFETQGSNFAVFTYFFVMAGFLFASTRVASLMGAAGASASTKIGNYGVASLYRNTAGRLAGGATKGFDFIGNRGGMVGRGAQLLLGGEQTRRTLEGAHAYKALGGQSRQGVLSDSKTVKDRRKSAAQERASTASENKLRSIIKSKASSTDPADTIALSDAVTGASTGQLIKELENASSSEYDAIVKNLSSSQYDKLMDAKPEEFNDANKDKLGSARRSQVEARLSAPAVGSNTPTSLGIAIRKASIEDLRVLDLQKQILPNAGELQAGQIDKMKDDSFFKGPRHDFIKKEYEAKLNTLSTSAIVNSRTNDDNIAKLPAAILTRRNPGGVYELINELMSSTPTKLTNSLLTKIATRDDLDGSVKRELGQAIIRVYGGDINNAQRFPAELRRFFTGGPGVQMT